jgi:hypothetical protein
VRKIHESWLVGLGAVLVACSGAEGLGEDTEQADEALVVNLVNGVDDIWQPGKQRDVTYCVSAKFNDANISGGSYQGDVDRGIRAAFDAWEASADVRFLHLTSSDSSCETASVNLQVVPKTTRVSGQGKAPYPSEADRQLELGVGGCDAAGKCIGLAKSNGSVQEWVRLIGIHEGGHGLGFRHEFAHPDHVPLVTNQNCINRLIGENWTDTNGDGRLDTNLTLRKVSAYDPQSAMDYVRDTDCGGTAIDTHITTSDTVGSQNLYGKPLKDIPLDLGAGVSTVGQMALSSWGVNRLDAFVRGSDDRLHHNWYEGSWHAWEIVGGTITSSPGAVSWGPGRIDVFARGSTGDLHHVWYSNGWGSESLGMPAATTVSTSEVAATTWGPNRLDVFVRGSDSKLYQIWFTDSWRGWTDLGGSISAGPGAVSWGSNRIDIFVRDANGGLQTKWWDNAGWHNFTSMGTPGGATLARVAPTVASMRSGRLDLFVRSSTGYIHHDWFDAGWSNTWELVAKTLNTSLAVRSWGDNRIDMIGVGQTAVHSGTSVTFTRFMRHGFFNGSVWGK